MDKSKWGTLRKGLMQLQDPHPDPLPPGEGAHRTLAVAELEWLEQQRPFSRREKDRMRVLKLREAYPEMLRVFHDPAPYAPQAAAMVNPGAE
jgi:hypothetical protein